MSAVSVFVGSIVFELFLASAIFCRGVGRFSWRRLWVLALAYVVCQASHAVFMSIPVGSQTLGGAAFYAFSFLLASVALASVFGFDATSALVLGSLGYTVQHLGSDLSYVLLDVGDLGLPGAAVSFYLAHTSVLLATYVVVYVLVGRRFRLDTKLVARRVSWVAASVAVLFFVIVFSMVFADTQTGVSRKIAYVYDALVTGLIMVVLLLAFRVDGLRSTMAASEAMWERKREEYELSRESIDLINVKCHDIRKRVSGLGGLSGESLDKVMDSIRIYDAQASTGNEALDVVLTAKSLICSQRGIELSRMVDGSCLAFIEDSELYSLMENILDNAIEATLAIGDVERRSIRLSVSREGGFASIREENYFEGSFDLSDGLPKTTKGDERNHGFGMRSIRRCVDDYGGEMSVRATDGVFSLSILLPIPS